MKSYKQYDPNSEACGPQCSEGLGVPGGVPEAPVGGIGMSDAAQKPPMSTVARERMILIIANNKKVVADAEEILLILNQRPELDASFCRLFGIVNNPNMKEL